MMQLETPPYLQNTEPMELEDVPLQVALLTMELATLRVLVLELAMALNQIADDESAGHA